MLQGLCIFVDVVIVVVIVGDAVGSGATVTRAVVAADVVILFFLGVIVVFFFSVRAVVIVVVPIAVIPYITSNKKFPALKSPCSKIIIMKIISIMNNNNVESLQARHSTNS